MVAQPANTAHPASDIASTALRTVVWVGIFIATAPGSKTYSAKNATRNPSVDNATCGTYWTFDAATGRQVPQRPPPVRPALKRAVNNCDRSRAG